MMRRAQRSQKRTVAAGAVGKRMSHAAAREIVVKAFQAEMGRKPTLAEAQAVQMISLGESGYGAHWTTADGKDSYNWGAVQAGQPPCAADAFLYTDTHPNADGTSTPYRICFRKYAGHVDGARHVVRILFKGQRALKAGTPAAAASGDLRRFAQAMYDQGYYEGWGATPEIRVNNQVKRTSAMLDDITKALNEPRASEAPGGGLGGGPNLAAGVALVLGAGLIYAGAR